MGDAIINYLVRRVFDSLFVVAKREIGYIRNCTENVNKLKSEVEKLKDMRGRFQKRIDEAKDRDDLLDGLQKWMDKADDEISNTDKFLEQEAKAKKNMKYAHHYSKAARNKLALILQHHEDGKAYESCVSIPIMSPGPIEVYQRKNLDDIGTQNLALEKIIRAIKDDCIQIVGIYGLGGVGKTTPAEEAALAVKNLFANVLLITVSQNVDVPSVFTR
nr:disease resistance protein At4g27190-like [Tanacetum cinerariifolium]